VRSALGTLPWVEQATIQTDIPTREVRFNLKDKKAFNEEEVRKALVDQRFKEVTVRSAPGR
jgi:hypothetical protein